MVLFAKPQRVIERMRRVCREGRNEGEAVVECRRYTKGELPLRTWDVTAHLGPDSVGLLARFAPPTSLQNDTSATTKPLTSRCSSR